ncbi:efflux RND transporter periplasmic adaptor subunit [Epilithonimonas hungarica]|uniref:HlyD family secretion protein n=1 Tax=Epilithonimonas hungarica TaxID=454006 RepID=A0A1G7NTV0_9FLAO|nr:efflux RND transporter periplasmic adaptor subunit [Epilithonimonas hungarica]MDP9954386.1 HlyD family secretion protein [Epilithonimonas hungarica]SDF77391.1 HlyD family secretion protein [Epilithonimonas hungarica]
MEKEKKKFTFKKAISIFLGLLFVVALVGGIGYLIKSNSAENEVFLTRKPSIKNLDDKVMATGKIEPREEIEIKPNIAGIIQTINVDEGDKVQAGQLIATIRIVPNITEVNNATMQVSNSQIQLTNAKVNVDNQQKQYEMQAKLYKQGVISKQEYITAQQQLETTVQQQKLAVQQLNAAQKQLQIVRTGATPELQSMATTQVRAKAAGTVLTIPVKVGSQVIEANSFNAGTTICSIADLNSLIFKGNIDEAQAGKLKQGMDMSVVIGALQNKSFPGKLTLIAPKGTEESGTIKFAVEGDVFNKTGEYIRAGFSANGEILLSSQKNALLLDESLIQYEKGNNKAFVEVKQPNGGFKKVYVKLGSSDGINVQILSGIDKNAEVKVWNPSDKDKEELKEQKKK